MIDWEDILLDISDGSGAIGAGPLDSELQRRWHVGLGEELASATALQ